MRWAAFFFALDQASVPSLCSGAFSAAAPV
jgi:hypothetical protein